MMLIYCIAMVVHGMRSGCQTQRYESHHHHHHPRGSIGSKFQALIDCVNEESRVWGR
jgi:hypothetical protein